MSCVCVCVCVFPNTYGMMQDRRGQMRECDGALALRVRVVSRRARARAPRSFIQLACASVRERVEMPGERERAATLHRHDSSIGRGTSGIGMWKKGGGELEGSSGQEHDS